jgi:hypothetical protein
MHGPSGIIPTRGQVTAIRAAGSLSELSSDSWSANEGFEYWFPRPVGKSKGTGKEENPLVILGGGREASKPTFEFYETDDSTVNEVVGKVLRDFLPMLFPGKYERGREPEMEWVSLLNDLAFHVGSDLMMSISASRQELWVSRNVVHLSVSCSVPPYKISLRKH